MASSKDCKYFKSEKDILKLKTEKNITYQEARRLVSVTSNLKATSYASVTKRVLCSAETQTMFTWPMKSKTPVEIPIQSIDKTLIPTKYMTTSSQTASTSTQFKPQPSRKPPNQTSPQTHNCKMLFKKFKSLALSFTPRQPRENQFGCHVCTSHPPHPPHLRSKRYTKHKIRICTRTQNNDSILMGETCTKVYPRG